MCFDKDMALQTEEEASHNIIIALGVNAFPNLARPCICMQKILYSVLIFWQ